MFKKNIFAAIMIFTGICGHSYALMEKAAPAPFVLITRLPSMPNGSPAAGDAMLRLDKDIQNVRISGFKKTKLPGGGVSFTRQLEEKECKLSPKEALKITNDFIKGNIEDIWGSRAQVTVQRMTSISKDSPVPGCTGYIIKYMLAYKDIAIIHDEVIVRVTGEEISLLTVTAKHKARAVTVAKDILMPAEALKKAAYYFPHPTIGTDKVFVRQVSFGYHIDLREVKSTGKIDDIPEKFPAVPVFYFKVKTGGGTKAHKVIIDARNGFLVYRDRH